MPFIDDDYGNGFNNVWKCDTCGYRELLPIPRPDVWECPKCNIKVRLI